MVAIKKLLEKDWLETRELEATPKKKKKKKKKHRGSGMGKAWGVFYLFWVSLHCGKKKIFV